MILITGIGRSGTKYTATLLQKARISVGHEMLLSDGIVCWKHAIFAAQFSPVIHQLRDPIHTIGSMQTISKDSIKYMDRYVITAKANNELHLLMQLWYKWQLLCEHYSKFTFRVENIAKSWDAIMEILLRKNVAMPIVPTDTHTRKGKYKPITLQQMFDIDRQLTIDIITFAKKYGYKY